MYVNRGLCEGAPYQRFLRKTDAVPTHIPCSWPTYSDHTTASELGYWHQAWRNEGVLRNHLPNLPYYLENDAQQNALDHYVTARNGGVVIFDNGAKGQNYKQFNHYQLTLTDPKQTLPSPKLNERTKLRIQRAVRNYLGLFPWNDPKPDFRMFWGRRMYQPEDTLKFYAEQCRRGVRWVHSGMSDFDLGSELRKKYPDLVSCYQPWMVGNDPQETWAGWSFGNEGAIRHRPPENPDVVLKNVKPTSDDNKYRLDQATKMKAALKNLGATFEQVYGSNTGLTPWGVASGNLLNIDPLGGAYQEYDNDGESKGYYPQAFPFKVRDFYTLTKGGKIEPEGALKEWLDRFAPESTASIFEKAAAARETRARKPDQKKKRDVEGVPGGFLASLRGLGQTEMSPSAKTAVALAGIVALGAGAYFLSRRKT